jgi:2'-5' RNA ligase
MTMLYTIAMPRLTEESTHQIDAVRAQFDSDFRAMVAPHFTLVFGCDALSQDHYIEHIESIATKQSQIYFECKYVMLGADDENETAYAFLVPDEGYAAISRLHDALYAGPLQSRLRLDLPYTPHITLGRFASRSQAKRVCDDLNAQPMIISGNLDSLHVGKIENGKFITIAKFDLENLTH